MAVPIEQSLIVAFPFRHHATHMHEEARRMLADAGFVIRQNDMGRALTRTEQKEMIRDAYSVIAGTEPYDAEMLAGCDKLRVLIRFGVGTDNFDLLTLKAMGVEVGVIANYKAVAEFTLMLILSAMKNLPQLDGAVREGRWRVFRCGSSRGKRSASWASAGSGGGSRNSSGALAFGSSHTTPT